MIKTPLSTVIGGAFWTPKATIIGGTSKTLDQLIKSLFANNEQGFFYDPNDLSTMFQDAAGTVPVTGVGQPVGLIRDKSGRNNHAYQTTSASRPILRKNAVTGANYLEFDGTDDSLQTNNIDFTATDKMSLFAGVRKLSDATSASVYELSDGTNTQLNAFSLFAPAGGGVHKYDFRNALGGIGASTTDVKYSAPVSVVVMGKLTLKDAIKAKLRLNGLDISTSTNGTNTNLVNAPLYIGRRGGISLPFTGHIYGLIGIGKLVSDNETAAIEKEIAKRTGVTLNV